MKKNLIIICCIAFSIINQSCKKDSNARNHESTTMNFKNSETNMAQTAFAKILANAVKENSELRNLLKKEGLKQFDNDYDVLYQKIKNEKLNGETVHEVLTRTGGISKITLDSITNNYPLLTIFIPKLPDFSVETWSPANEIPLVAAANIGEKDITLYGSGEEKVTIKENQIPSFPILVIKQNERLIVGNRSSSTQTLSTKSGSSTIAYQDGGLFISFADKAFNGTKSIVQTNSIQASVASNKIDPINIEAYNSGNEWHRDYIYYGITASNPNGEFRHNYSEFITSFRFLTPNALAIISDQDGDPRKNDLYGSGKTVPQVPPTMWTDGNFEFKITVLINAKNGVGSELTKIMSVKPSEVFDLQYDLVVDNGPYKIYQLKNIVPKEFNPNIELVPWDLENYGTAWKFIFYEIDNAQEITQSYENSTTYAGNFGIEVGVSKKLGLKFGGSATTTSKTSYSIKTTLDSDFLGEAVLSFDQPIIISGNTDGNYAVREITTGNLLSIGVQPKKVF